MGAAASGSHEVALTGLTFFMQPLGNRCRATLDKSPTC